MSTNKIHGTCHVCNTSDQSKIVYSGVDALVLGIPGAETGTTCYDCARKTALNDESQANHVGLCKYCNELDSSKLVHSGVDALVLGLEETGKVCYTCANARRKE